ncbi:hypothetical protein ACOYR1_16450 [Thalassotalea piscium]
MLKRKPWQLTLPHQLSMLLPLLFFTPQNILEIGLGGGAFRRYINQLLPECNFSSVELNEVIIECFHSFFNPHNIDTRIIHHSAEKWLTTQSQLTFDWIIIDIFVSIEDSVISYQLIETLLNQTQSNTIITLNLPNEKEQQINTLLTHLKCHPNIHVVYFTIPHYKNIILHILPTTKTKQLTPKTPSPLKEHQQRRWQRIWQQGIHV